MTRQPTDAWIAVLRRVLGPQWTDCPTNPETSQTPPMRMWVTGQRWTVAVLCAPPATIRIAGPDVLLTVKAIEPDAIPALLAAIDAPRLTVEGISPALLPSTGIGAV